MKEGLLGTIRRTFAFFILIAMFISAHTPDVYAVGNITRVSVASSGAQADAISYSGQISANGRFAVFDSEAGNLAPGDSNGQGDVFIRDLEAQTTARVSQDVNGAQGDGGSGGPSVSADGRYVAFESGATNLVPGDLNGFSDIFIKDMVTGSLTLVSVDSNGLQAAGDSYAPSISGDGRYVAFVSSADNLTPNDVNEAYDIFLRDTLAGTTVRVSRDANGSSWDPSISLDGRFIVFSSGASNLVSDDTNAKSDVFVYEVSSGLITRVSVNSAGQQGDHASMDPSISGDGRYVAFSSASYNFQDIDTLNFTYVYVHDRQTGQLSLISFKDGYPMYGTADATAISANGRYVVFSFDERGDSLPVRWLYMHDRATGKTEMVVSGGNSDGQDNPLLPSISADGDRLLFVSSAASLVPGDTNGVRDVFVKEIVHTDDSAPIVVSMQRSCAGGCPSSASQSVDFSVQFSEDVTGVDAGDFFINMSGGVSSASITAVSGAGSQYIVTVDTGSGDGTIQITLIDNDSIFDSASHPLGGVGTGNGSFLFGESHTVIKSFPVVTGIFRLDPTPFNGAVMRFAVNFSSPVTGVDSQDFSTALTGSLTGASITQVSGSGNSYVAEVLVTGGEGTLRLDLLDNDSIVNDVLAPLGGSENADYTAGEVYVIDRAPPQIVAIQRMDQDPTSADVVRFKVVFSEAVSGFAPSDFALAGMGVVNPFITEVIVLSNELIVSVNTGFGNGQIRLDVVDNDNIIDALGNPLGGPGAGNGGFSAGETYSVMKIQYKIENVKFRSNGRNDGWVLESSEESGVGGSKNSNAEALAVGDDARNRQYRTILYFPTYYLPDNAVVTSAVLVIRSKNVVGSDPFLTHGNILVDIRRGLFDLWGFWNPGLQLYDFQSPADLNSVARIENNPVKGWYWAALDGNSLEYINLTGITQLRLGFELDDDNDFFEDKIIFFSGDAPAQVDRPHLLIEYYIP